MKLPWVARVRYDAVCESLEVEGRRLWGVIHKLTDAAAEVVRLKDLLTRVYDEGDFWRESYKTEHEAHEKTKRQKSYVKEKWEWWRKRALKLSYRAAFKENEEAKKAEARRDFKNPAIVIESILDAGFMPEMHLSRELLAALRDAVDTGRLGSKSSGDNSSSRRG